MPPAQGLQVQMAGLASVQDGLDDVGRKQGQPQYLGHPAGFVPQGARQLGGGGVAPLVEQALPVKALPSILIIGSSGRPTAASTRAAAG